jgi:conjugal transfer pilus assembly protein TraB
VDSPEKIKRKQIAIFVGGLSIFILIMVFGMWLSDPNRGKPSPWEVRQQKAKEVMKDFTARSSNAVSSEESWIALSEKQLKQLQNENIELKRNMEEILILLKEKETNSTSKHTDTSSILPNTSPALPPPPKPLSQPDAMQQFGQQSLNQTLPPPPPLGDYKNPPIKVQNTKPSDSIQLVNLENEEIKDEKKKKKNKNVSHYLPTGAFATAVLLSGMDAPTGGQAKTNPVPVLLRVKDAGQLPNFFNSEIDNCHVLGASYGDIASERAHIRLESMTCVLINGDIIEEKIAGYVAGEDGKAGLRGRLVSKQGALIAKSLLAGISSGVGRSVSQQYQQVSTSALGSVTSVDPKKSFENGLAMGTSNALDKIADFYIDRANEIYPIIEVDANRIGEIILTGGTDLEKNLIGNTRKHKS